MAFARYHTLVALTNITDCCSLVPKGAGVLHVWGGCHVQWTTLSPLTENAFFSHIRTGNNGNAF